MVAREHESAVDVPQFHVLFNQALLGRHLNAMKFTVTRDTVDCGERKIVEEITLSKYKDLEEFSFREVVDKLRANVDCFLRIHLISNLLYKDSVTRLETMIAIDEELEENQAKKRNKYIDFMCQFTGQHPVPTQNTELMQIHEKVEAY